MQESMKKMEIFLLINVVLMLIVNASQGIVAQKKVVNEDILKLE
jgi:hypothetical protein